MVLWSVPGGVLVLLTLLFTPSTCQWQDGDIRLVGGSYQWEGRVEVYMSEEWGTIADSDWTDDDAAVVCRKLGHFRPGATAHSRAYFGEGKGPVNLDLVKCTGKEYILTDCEIGNSGNGASHSLDVGVKCQPAIGSYREGDIRLVGGPRNWEGRVELFWEGEWGAISDSQWTDTDALIVCRQLQHASESGEAVPCCGTYGKGNDPIHIRTVGCSGLESDITSCSYFNVTVPPPHTLDVGVMCEQGNETREGEIRLNRTYGPNNAWEGRVEIFLSGEWGTICDDGRRNANAYVVCRQLGYYIYDTSHGCCSSVFGRGTGPIHIEVLDCSGSEYGVAECGTSTSSCSHNEDWRVYCRIDGPEAQDVRLHYDYYYGYVQVFLSDEWVPVASTDIPWTTMNSEVVCRELGYDSNGTSTNYYYYSIYNTYKTMDNVACIGTESQLRNCAHDIHFTDVFDVHEIECRYFQCNTGDIRLVGGETEREGRVEVCNDWRWGTVCDSHWDINETAVVCTFLGYSDLPDDLAYVSSDKYGEGTGPVFMDFVNCTGTEDSLWYDCTHRTHYFGCSHDNDVGVQCKPARCSDGQLRLIGGSEEQYGRLEMCSNQRWGTFSSSSWSTDNSFVACTELGYQFYSSWLTSGYGNSGAPRHSKYFQCTRSELRLSQCLSFNETRSRTYGYDVGMSCSEVDCENGEMRLMEGKEEWQGRLEVCYNRRWGTVSGDNWTLTNSHVVCNALGYNTTNERANQSTPGAPSKPLYYHDVRCSERDMTLLDCGFTVYTDFTMTHSHAIVKCKQPTCKDGDLRLIGGTSGTEGRLEVCFNKRWGTIDGDGWTHTDTHVACKQLGHPTEDTSYTKSERMRYNLGQSLPTFMTFVGCYGDEQKLIDCAYHEFESRSTLMTSNDVSISCGAVASSNTQSASASASASSETVASLYISVIFSLAVIALVAALIILLIIQRRKKTAKRDLSGFSAANPTNGGGLSSPGIHYTSKTEKVSLDNKMEMEDLPAESYEEVEAPNPLPIPPKPQPKKAQNKSRNTTQKVDSSRYARGAHAAPTTGPKPTGSRPQAHSQAHPQAHPQSYSQAHPQVHSQGRSQVHHNWAQQQPVRSGSPEVIYECPD